MCAAADGDRLRSQRLVCPRPRPHSQLKGWGWGTPRRGSASSWVFVKCVLPFPLRSAAWTAIRLANGTLRMGGGQGEMGNSSPPWRGGRLVTPEPEVPVCRWVGGGAKPMPSPRENAEAQDRARRRGVKRVLGGEGDRRLSLEPRPQGAECSLWPVYIMARIQNPITASPGTPHDFPFS